MEEDPQPSSSSTKMETEDEENPIKKMANKTEEAVKKEEVEFYDPTEDDENEKWVAERSSKAKGGTAPNTK